MPGYKLLALPSGRRYIYDGSLPGLYCAIHAAIYARELPVEITPGERAQPSLLPEHHILTDEMVARRVRNSVQDKISLRARELIETVYCSCLREKEVAILRFLLLGYDVGAGVIGMLAHPDVHTVLHAESALWSEQHKLTGFIRFAEYGDMLAATITPKNFVLPFLARHFSGRYSEENFLIYDKTHGAALLYERGNTELINMEALALAPPDEKERQYQQLWRRFYDTIAIEARYNPKCRMTHMPKRYWENMTEMQEPEETVSALAEPAKGLLKSGELRSTTPPAKRLLDLGAAGVFQAPHYHGRR